MPPPERAILQSQMTRLTLKSGQVLYAQKDPIKHLYFPETAVASLVNHMRNGRGAEVGTIGNEGATGLGLLLGANRAESTTLIQIPGTALRMRTDAFLAALPLSPRFRKIVGGCLSAFMVQVSQTAACNGLHTVDQRCARWLLLTHDRVGGSDSFSLTHQFLSFMLGVRRAGVTEALGTLGDAGLIASDRGRITIINRAGLERACCECYGAGRRLAGELFPM